MRSAVVRNITVSEVANSADFMCAALKFIRFGMRDSNWRRVLQMCVKNTTLEFALDLSNFVIPIRDNTNENVIAYANDDRSSSIVPAQRRAARIRLLGSDHKSDKFRLVFANSICLR